MSPPNNDVFESQSKKRKRQNQEIDRFKKMQCSVALKRLMVHRDSWPFKKSAGKPLGYVHALSEPVMHFEIIKWKLDNNFYLNTDEFASDVKEMFHNVTLQYGRRHEIHHIAVRMGQYFEMKWASLEERWASEKENEKLKPKQNEKEKEKQKLKKENEKQNEKEKEEAKLKRKKVNHVSVDMKPHEPKQNEKEKEKPKLKRIKENHVSVDMKPHEPILDTILASQNSLFGWKANEEMKWKNEIQRKKERQDAREILHNTRRTVYINDNKFYEDELRQLCGRSLVNNPVKKYCGLVLKDDLID